AVKPAPPSLAAWGGTGPAAGGPLARPRKGSPPGAGAYRAGRRAGRTSASAKAGRACLLGQNPRPPLQPPPPPPRPRGGRADNPPAQGRVPARPPPRVRVGPGGATAMARPC